MSNAIIVHGKPGRDEYYDPDVPSSSNHHWLPWLAKQFILREISASTPEMPHAYAPDYPIWCREFERHDITPNTILVGHSRGAGFLTRWLSDHPRVRVGRVALVAPWLDPEGTEAPEFFDFQLDPDLSGRTDGLLVVNSDDDGPGIQRSVELIRNTVADIHYHEFHQHGHFTTTDLGGNQFPALIELLALRNQPKVSGKAPDPHDRH